MAVAVVQLAIALPVLLIALYVLAATLSAVEAERASRAADRAGVAGFLEAFWNRLGVAARAPAKDAQKLFSAVVSRLAAAKLVAVTAWFAGLAAWWFALLTGIAGFALATTLAIERLVAVTIPRAAERAALPGRLAARTALRRALDAARRARLARLAAAGAAGIAIGTGIRLGRRIGALDHAIDWLRKRTRTIGNRVGRIARRLSKVEKRVTFAALAAVVIRVLARRFPWLFCRKVRRIGRQACALDNDLLESLLMDALVIGSLISVVEFTRAVQVVAAPTVDALRAGLR